LPAGHALAIVLGEYFAAAQARVAGIVDDVDPECLHDFRTAMRRARSLVLNVRGVIPGDRRPAIKAAFAWLSAMTGDLRDLDVLTAQWPAIVSRLPVGLGDHIATANAMLAAKRAAALVRVRRGFESDRWLAFSQTWPGFLTQLDRGQVGGRAAVKPVAVVAARSIGRLHRELIEQIEKADSAGALEPLHELRKLGKKLRYLIEAFAALYRDTDVKASVDALKQLQDELGVPCDCEAQFAIIGRWRTALTRRARVPKDVLELLEWVHSDLYARKSPPRPGIERALRRFMRPRTRRHFARLLKAR
jgi:CHAD domain-containing protein